MNGATNAGVHGGPIARPDSNTPSALKIRGFHRREPNGGTTESMPERNGDGVSGPIWASGGYASSAGGVKLHRWQGDAVEGAGGGVDAPRCPVRRGNGKGRTGLSLDPSPPPAPRRTRGVFRPGGG